MPTAMTGGPGEVVPVVARVDLPGGAATPMAKAHSGSPMAVATIDQKDTGDPQGSQGLDLGEDVGAQQGTVDPLATQVFQLPPLPSSDRC